MANEDYEIFGNYPHTQQRAFYSGKRKRHVLKAQLIIGEESGEITGPSSAKVARTITNCFKRAA